mgnify:CR=1 FL=1
MAKINKKITLFSDFTIKEQMPMDSSSEFESGTEELPLVITGYANTTGKDRSNDVIPDSAWKGEALTNYKKNPIILAFHDHTKPIGTCDEATIDSKGLKVVATISKAAGEVYDLIKEGILKAFSVGFIVKDADWDPKSDVFVIKDLELLEISVVSVPCNQDSTFSLAKAFSDEELAEFKKSFIKEEGTSTEQLENPSEIDEKTQLNMDKEQLEQLVKSAAEAAAKTVAEQAAVTLTKSVELGQSGAEKLLADVEARFAANEEKGLKAIADLRGELNEKAAELEALQKSKMQFDEKALADKISIGEKEAAFLLAKITGKNIKDTKLFGNIVEKYGAHVASADWENVVSTNMQEDIRRKLVIAPQFTTLTMNAPVIKMPLNPEAGYATWVTSGSFMSTASSGTAATHALQELTISAYKLATKEFLGVEEEDDSIIPLLPIIRNAMVRRMAKAEDKALLLGAGSGVDPLKGITKYATAIDTTTTTTAKITAATLMGIRRNLGVWGLTPSDLVYLVSQDAYYDLLEDTNFLTMDKAGANATLFNGQIGYVGGTPVIVSGEFEAKAAGKYNAICLNASNFMLGRYKNLMLESDYFVESQQKILVATERLGFLQVTTANGQGVACNKWL